jgi:hypothetical protein
MALVQSSKVPSLKHQDCTEEKHKKFDSRPDEYAKAVQL